MVSQFDVERINDITGQYSMPDTLELIAKSLLLTVARRANKTPEEIARSLQRTEPIAGKIIREIGGGGIKRYEAVGMCAILLWAISDCVSRSSLKGTETGADNPGD
jgi:hypothetical protein